MIKLILDEEESKLLDYAHYVIVPSNYEFYYKNKYIDKNYNIITFDKFLLENYDGGKKIINDNEDYIFMLQTYEEVKEKLENYQDIKEQSFISDLLNTYKKFKNIDLNDSAKIRDLKKIFELYEEKLKSSNFLNRVMLTETILNELTLNKKYLFLDFVDLNDEEFKVLKKINEEGEAFFKVSKLKNSLLINKLQKIDKKIKFEGEVNKTKAYFKALNDIEDEILFVLNDISLKKYKYNAQNDDFILVSNDVSNYLPYMELLFDIPFSCKTLANTFTSRFINCFSKILAGNFSNENFMNLLKLNIFNIDLALIDKLDNYIYSWNLENDDFYIPFKFNPNGNKKSFSTNDKEDLKVLNEAKEKIINPIKYLLENVLNEKDAKSILKWIYTYFEEEDLVQKLYKTDSEGYNNLIKVMEDISNYYEKETSVGEIINLINNLLKLKEKTVRKNNEILIVALNDACFYDKKYVYFLGASEDKFPKTYQFNTLLNSHDVKKEWLINRLEEFALKEEYLFNKLFNNKEVTVTYHKLSSDLKLNNMSKLLENIELLKMKEEKIYNENILINKYALNLSNDKVYKKDLGDGLINKINISNSHNLNYKLSKESARKLYSDEITSSPSSIETFSKCAFYYFCLYGLKLKIKEKFIFDNREVGTFVHYLLENILKNEFDNITTDNLKDMVIKYSKNYLEEKNKIVTNSTNFVIEKLSDNVTLLLRNIIKEQNISKFKPTYFEFRLEDGNVIKPFVIKGNNASLKLTGVIDRVDVYEDDENFYYRIIDYKTGEKKFRLDDCLEGLNLQMLLYLLAIKENGKDITTKNVVPAGLFYYPALVKEKMVSRKLDEEELYKTVGDRIKMTGIISSDENVIEAMGEDSIGEFIDVVSYGKINPEKTFGMDNLALLFDHIKEELKKISENILDGNISVNPVGGRIDSCSYCKFSSICSFDKNIDKARKIKNYKNSEVFKMLEGDKNA